MMQQTVLIVDAEPDLVRLVKSNLRTAGYSVITAQNGQEAITITRKKRPHLVILDLMLPEISGFEVCRLLKSDPDVARIPIIILTAKGDEIFQVVGFELGADDFLTKPFSPRVLLLRVRAVLSRTAGILSNVHSTTKEMQRHNASQESGIKLDRDRCEVRVRGEAIEFSPTEFKLLAILLEHPGKVYSRKVLSCEVLGYKEEAAETRTVDMHVLRVREKLGAAAKYLETVRGFGYRFAESKSC